MARERVASRTLTTVLTSGTQLREAVRGWAGPAVVVADPRFRGTARMAWLRATLASCGKPAPVLSRSRWGALEDAHALAAALGPAQTVVAVGGGSVLDCAKLALALEDEGTCAAVDVAQRSGWVSVVGQPRQRRLVAIPTTLGTSSELSPIVSFVHRGDKRALTSPQLPADLALVTPVCTAGLTREQVLEAALEALLRAAGPYVGDHVDRPEQDADALALVRALASWVGRLGSASEPAGATGRFALALLSQGTQDPTLLAGRPLFAAKWWFVANNVAHALGVPKMTALLWVLPRFWAHLPSLPVLGSVEHRDVVWSALREQIPVRLPQEPGEGLEALVRWLGLPTLPDLSRELAEGIARSCTRIWGGGLPMLAGLPSAQLVDLLIAEPPSPDTRGLPRLTTPRQTAAVATHPN